MKIIIAPDSFKGTFSSLEAARAMASGVLGRFPSAEVVEIPLADGGEGTLDVVLGGTGGERMTTSVSDPLGREIDADWALLPGGGALVEMARSSGLGLLSPTERDPWSVGTFGLGQIIRAALDRGIGSLAVTLGGSATVDGGAGMARALGWRFYDREGRLIDRDGGRVLGEISRIDSTGADKRLAGVEVRALCDVTNPLLGKPGAARVFGPQKGADPDMVERLEAGLANLANRLKDDLGADVADLPGAGAAGGLGAAVAAFLGGRLVSGIAYVLDTLNFDSHLRGADLVISGEGSFDSQSMGGKAVSGVLERAGAAGVPVAVVCGVSQHTDSSRLKVFSGADLPPDLKPGGMVGLDGLAQLAAEATATLLKT